MNEMVNAKKMLSYYGPHKNNWNKMVNAWKIPSEYIMA